MGRPLVFLGPWDLGEDLAVLDVAPDAVDVLFVESVAKGAMLPWHRKKLVLVLSAMHHRAEALRAQGFEVWVRNAPTYVEGITAHLRERGNGCVRAMQPKEIGLDKAIRAADLGVPLELVPDVAPGGHFLLSREDFAAWAEAQSGSRLSMDRFYRWMRQRLDLLMDGEEPVGGAWSFDKENRKPVKGACPPPVRSHPPDALTQAWMERVEGWEGRWGTTAGFDWPVDRAGALAELEDFLAHRLARYGDHQDAMLTGYPWMWHARLSAAMNLGLLGPREVVDGALAAYAAGEAPLNAVEGFVRQVIGWREFVRGIYWMRGEELRTANLLEADRPLPDFYWDPSKTDMRCMKEAVRSVWEHGYAHHIQRLMVLGNHAMLLGVAPDQIHRWFWAGFVDAYEWVELPNVVGMAIYADDGFTTKPYAAGGNYLRKMSNHCGTCRYDVKKLHGSDACPFNPLFWDFMARHEARFAKNPRLAALYGNWRRWSEEERCAIREDAG